MTIKIFYIVIVLACFLFSKENISDDVITITPKQTENGYEFLLQNNGSVAYKVFVDVELTNMRSDVTFPYTAVLSPHSRKTAFTLLRADESQKSGYRFDYKWRKAHSKDRSCAKDVFCIVSELRGDSLYFSLENKQFLPIAVKFIPNGFRNLDMNTPMPFTKTYGGLKTSKMFTAWLVDSWSGWEQTYRYQWQYGIANAKHDDSYAYALPYKRGTEYIMTQGPNGDVSHKGKNAYDWEMPEGTIVRAAREGIVMSVIESYTTGGTAEYLKKNANSVEILHPDGTIGIYSHLEKDGVLVKIGDRIRRGQKVALSGNTGYSTGPGPHLHFEVIRLTKDLEFESVPLRFRVSKTRIRRLNKGDRYKAFE